MRAVVVTPTYNERDNVMPLLDLIGKHAAELHVLIVDDHSPDGTGQVAQRASERWQGRVFTLHRASKSGLGAAYRDGFRYVLSLGYDTILQMDADLSHDPAALPGLLEALKNADLVLGSRYLGGIRVINWDFKRLLLSKAAVGLPIVFHERRLGQSKIDYRIILEAAIGVLRLGLITRTRRAARNR
jgi:dolichol-phosphate mannosyltransferase